MSEHSDQNASAVGIAAARMMEKIEEVYPDESRVTEVMVLVEVATPINVEPDEGDPESGPQHSVTDYFCSDHRRVVQLGMLDDARMIIMEEAKAKLWEGVEDDEEEDEGDEPT